jgi:hypothetical protein
MLSDDVVIVIGHENETAFFDAHVCARGTSDHDARRYRGRVTQ